MQGAVGNMSLTARVCTSTELPTAAAASMTVDPTASTSARDNVVPVPVAVTDPEPVTCNEQPNNKACCASVKQ